MKLNLISLLRLALIGAALLAFGYQVALADRVLHGTLIDDAYISLRYADNLASGLGPVWQAGDRVEGYTNFLLVAGLAISAKLGLNSEFSARVIGVAAGVGVLLLLAYLPHCWQSALEARRWPSGLGALAIGSSFYFPYWSNLGLETSLFIFWCLAAFLLTYRALTRLSQRRYALTAGLCLTALAMTRPDGLIIVAVIFCVWLGIAVRSGNERVAATRSLAFAVGVFSLLYGSYFIWRVAYYGQLWPNPFYVKVGIGLAQIERGFAYLQATVSKVGLLALLLAAPLALLPRPDRSSLPAIAERARRAVIVMMLLSAVLYTAYLIYIGGDNFGPRLALIVFVICAALADVGLSCVAGLLSGRPQVARASTPIVFVIALLMVLHPWSLSLRAPDVRNAQPQLNWKQLGLWLRSNAQPHDIIAVDAAGAIPYFSQLRSIDMLGLNDRYIAQLEMPDKRQELSGHEKYDPTYVLAQQPDWLATWIDRAGEPSLYGLAHRPEMAAYRPYLLIQTGDPGRPWLHLIVSDLDRVQRWDEGYTYALWKRSTPKE